MNTKISLFILFICSMIGIAGYSTIQSEYHGSGLQPVRNLFKDTISFDDAIQALKEGQRIRRKKEIRGYTKIVICEGKTKKVKFGSCLVGTNNSLLDYCTFSIEDVLANDWIIDEET